MVGSYVRKYMLQISESAAEHLNTLLEEKRALEGSENWGLRVYVEKGGCAGYQYEMKIDVGRPGDLFSEKNGVRVMVDEQSSPFLRGAHLDYCDDLMGTGFRIVNPQAARSCGCGTSFEPSAERREGAPAG
jgi:iron-sulfur cluster assembly accessory protein